MHVCEVSGVVNRVKAIRGDWKLLELRSGITVKGLFFDVVEGDLLAIRGVWTDFKGQKTLQMETFDTVIETTQDGTMRFLRRIAREDISSKALKEIYEAFKGDTIRVLLESPHDLDSLPLLSLEKKLLHERAKRIVYQKEIKDFLVSNQVAAPLADAISRKANCSKSSIAANPYSLIQLGVSFTHADDIAEAVKFDLHRRERVEALILFTLAEHSEHGHCCWQPSELLAKVSSKLAERENGYVSPPRVEALFSEMVKEGKIVLYDGAAFLTTYANYEESVASRLSNLLSTDSFAKGFFSEERLTAWIASRETSLSDKQMTAVTNAFKEKVLIVTGGPGTGKTTLIREIVETCTHLELPFHLAAPTGRAAKRLEEASGHPAKTIHRLLSYNPQLEDFSYTATNQLPEAFFVIDESSMIDVWLAAKLLEAIPSGSTVIFVGDADQLKSVGAGSVLRDLIKSKAIPTIELKTVFRQAEKSLIVKNAHRINKGEDVIEGDKAKKDNCFTRRTDDLLGAVRSAFEAIPSRIGIPASEIQVICCRRKEGGVNVDALNSLLQDLQNKDGATVADKRFRVGDRVMQIRNNYDKGVYNGDIGHIKRKHSHGIVVLFDSEEVEYLFSELGDLTLAYACTIHKAQGSEYKAVVIVLSEKDGPLLQRNLIYTALTRARDFAYIIYSTDALDRAIRNNSPQYRLTKLHKRIKAAKREAVKALNSSGVRRFFTAPKVPEKTDLQVILTAVEQDSVSSVSYYTLSNGAISRTDLEFSCDPDLAILTSFSTILRSCMSGTEIYSLLDLEAVLNRRSKSAIAETVRSLLDERNCTVHRVTSIEQDNKIWNKCIDETIRK